MEKLIIEAGNKKYIAVISEKYSCDGCAFAMDEECPTILTKVDCGNLIWKEHKEDDAKC